MQGKEPVMSSSQSEASQRLSIIDLIKTALIKIECLEEQCAQMHEAIDEAYTDKSNNEHHEL